MNDLNDVKKWAKTATEGELIHLVNHLYKHYEIFPTKLKGVVEEAVAARPKFPIGTLVKVVYADHKTNELKPGMMGFIKDIDEDDEALPYLVMFIDADGDQICDWAPVDQLIVVDRVG